MTAIAPAISSRMIAQVSLVDAHGEVLLDKYGEERSVSAMKLYRLTSTLLLTCPRCKHACDVEEVCVVAPYRVAVPRFLRCKLCGDADEASDERAMCPRCHGKGFIVVNDGYVYLDLVCVPCTAELRGGRRPMVGTSVFTTTSRAGEPTHRPTRNVSMKAGPMCTGCQQRPSKRTGLCNLCADEERRKTSRLVGDIRRRIDALDWPPFLPEHATSAWCDLRSRDVLVGTRSGEVLDFTQRWPK